MTIQPAYQDIRTLILAADADTERMAAAVEAVGPVRTAEILADELVNQADLHEIAGLENAPIVVQLDLRFGADTVRHHIRAAKSTEHAPGPAEQPNASVEIELTELLRAVLGSARTPECQNLRVHWHDLEDPARLGPAMHVFPVVRRLVRGTGEPPADLADLALRNGSDKWGLHYYTPHYERHFAPYRHRPLTVLELGIGGFGNPESGGGSLRMWKRYFPRALVYGVDVFDKTAIREQRIHTVQGDLASSEFLTSLGTDLGPFDIVIDDGNHYCPDVVRAFQTLFPYVRQGGLYVIEDLQTSYWPGYGGSSERLDDPLTSMGFLKRLLDGLHYEERDLPDGEQPTEIDRTLTGAHFYRSLAVLEKGVNAEGPSPSWIPRERMTQEQMAAVDWGEGLSGSDD